MTCLFRVTYKEQDVRSDNNIVHFNIRGDERGLLIALEENHNVPFDIRRVFYIYATKAGVNRGEHAHYKTKQLLVAVAGSCRVTLCDGHTEKTYTLDTPDTGLFQDALIWGSMHDFSPDCVLMVLADTYYREDDYIRDYNTYLESIA